MVKSANLAKVCKPSQGLPAKTARTEANHEEYTIYPTLEQS